MKIPWAEKVQTFSELGRISNLPTVLSNVTVGYLLGRGNIGGSDIFREPLRWFMAVGVVASFYEGGMFLNDFCDVKIDSLERPSRPIPSGRVSPKIVLRFAVLLMVFGLFGTALWIPSGLWIAFVLFGLIVVYSFTHSSFFLAPLIMGCCRGCVYLLSACAAGWRFSFDTVFAMAVVLTLYVAAASWIARDEMKVGTSKFPAVGLMLSGISLVDAVIMASMNSVTGVVISGLCFIGARVWQKKIPPT